MGCGQRVLVVQRVIEPTIDPMTDTSLGLRGSDLMLAQFTPLLQRQGIEPMALEREPRWIMTVGDVAQRDGVQRVLHEYEVSDGGRFAVNVPITK